MTELADQIRERGHWWFVIHPTDYEPNRITLDEAEAILWRSRVQLRGWDFPHVSTSEPIKTRLKSIGSSTDWMYYREEWRFYKSAQFTYLLGIHEDWVERTNQTPLGAGWSLPTAVRDAGPLLGVGDSLFRITEAFEFASRLAVTPAGGEAMHIRIEVGGLQNRMLWVDSPKRWPMDHEYRADIATFPFEDDFSASDLAANGWNSAVDVALELFRMFGWRPPREMLVQQQAELRTRQ